MIVELFGLPGSGKTSSLRQISIHYHIPIIRTGRIERYALFLLFCSSNPRTTWTFVRLILLETGFNWRLLFRKFKLLVGAFGRAQKASILGQGLVENGLFQLLLTVYEERVSIDDLETIELPACRGRRCVLVFEVQPAICARRCVARGGAPRIEFGADYQQRWWAVSCDNFETIKKFVMRDFQGISYRDSAG